MAHLITPAVRAYLICGALFEIPSIVAATSKGATESSAILRELMGGGMPMRNKGVDKLWVFFLFNLLISRLTAAYAPLMKPVMGLVAAIHVSEAALFVSVLPPSKWKPEHWVVPVSIAQATMLVLHFLLA